MFRLLATTTSKRQQIAMLIISFFAYVAGIRNEDNNMLLQQQQQQQPTIENSNYESSLIDGKQQSTLNFRPSQAISFTPANAIIPQQFQPNNKGAQHAAKYYTAIHNNNHNNIPQKQATENTYKPYAIEAAATYESAAEKQFSFPNEQQQTPQHLTDKPIYIYSDPLTNENYHYRPTETDVMDTTYNNNNNNAYKQQHSQHDDNQEYLVQSSMIVGAHQQQHKQPAANPFRPYMSLSADKDVYLKRPGLVYDDKPSYNQPNLVTEKKRDKDETFNVNKISYDSHDYPPPSYFQQQTSNFLPRPAPAHLSSSRPPTTTPPRKEIKPTFPIRSTRVGQQRPQQQYLQSTLPNYANSIDSYLFNKQQTSDHYRTEVPPPSYLQHKQPQIQYQYTNRPFFEYAFKPQSSPPSYAQQHQYFSRPPTYSAEQAPFPQYETTRPPPGRPSHNNYYNYQIGEIPPQAQTSSSLLQQFNYPYPRPPYQGPYRPPPTPPVAQQQQQQSGLATLAQYAPQFTSLLLSSVGGGGGEGTNIKSPFGSLIGVLTGAATSQQSASLPSSSSSYTRRPLNSQLIKALENIARNDDLQCVPKVLCQMIAAQTQRGQLPTFITSPAITNFLAGFPAASPALIYGRAALLGISGGERSCHQTYMKCPKNEYEIIYYLNNHRGGFFKFFSEPEEQQQTVNHDSAQQGPTSLFSILAALNGSPQAATIPPSPTRKPQLPSTGITSGIGSFFTQLLSDYMGDDAVEYQRRFKRSTKRSQDDKIKFEDEESGRNHTDVLKFQDESSKSQREALKFKDENRHVVGESHQNNEEDFHDEEDEADTQQNVDFKDDEQVYVDDAEVGKFQQTSEGVKRINFFPQMSAKQFLGEIDNEEVVKKIIKKFNEFNRERKLKFPTSTDERKYLDAFNQRYGHQFSNYVENFDQSADNEQQAQSLYSHYLKTAKDPKTKFLFPEREGKILSHPDNAASYLQAYLQPEQLKQQALIDQKHDQFIIPNNQRPLLSNEFPSTSFANVHNSQLNYIKTQNSFTSNTAVNNIYVASSTANINNNNNHFLPTPPPSNNDYTSSNTTYASKGDSSSNYSILKQSSSYNPLVYSTATTSSTPSSKGDSQKFFKPQPYISSEGQANQYNRYPSFLYTTRRPYVSVTTTKKADNKNIYVTNSRGVTEYYVTPDGKKVYL